MAADGVFFRSLAAIHPRYRTPVRSLWAQSAWAVVLTASGTYDQLFTYVVFAAAPLPRRHRRRRVRPAAHAAGGATAVPRLGLPGRARPVHPVLAPPGREHAPRAPTRVAPRPRPRRARSAGVPVLAPPLRLAFTFLHSLDVAPCQSVVPSAAPGWQGPCCRSPLHGKLLEPYRLPSHPSARALARDPSRLARRRHRHTRARHPVRRGLEVLLLLGLPRRSQADVVSPGRRLRPRGSRRQGLRRPRPGRRRAGEAGHAAALRARGVHRRRGPALPRPRRDRHPARDGCRS